MACHLIEEALPQFSKELRALLLASKEPELAEQIPQLEITRRCSCVDDFCATFYTKYEPSTRPFQNAHSLELEPEEGMIIINVASGRIAEVEVLYRDDVRRQIRAIFP